MRKWKNNRPHCVRNKWIIVSLEILGELISTQQMNDRILVRNKSIKWTHK